MKATLLFAFFKIGTFCFGQDTSGQFYREYAFLHYNSNFSNNYLINDGNYLVALFSSNYVKSTKDSHRNLKLLIKVLNTNVLKNNFKYKLPDINFDIKLRYLDWYKGGREIFCGNYVGKLKVIEYKENEYLIIKIELLCSGADGENIPKKYIKEIKFIDFLKYHNSKKQ